MAPASPPTKPWWQRGWGVTTIGVAGLLVGAGVGIAANAHTETVTTRNTTTAVRAAPAPVHTETQTVTHTVTHTFALTTPEPSHTVASAPGSAPTTFSGSGQKLLGTITVPQKSAIHWQAGGGYFHLGTGPPEFTVYELSKKGTSGKSGIARGTYSHLEVTAAGEWSFTLTPEY